jgi:hypothetical protein
MCGSRSHQDCTSRSDKNALVDDRSPAVDERTALINLLRSALVDLIRTKHEILTGKHWKMRAVQQ